MSWISGKSKNGEQVVHPRTDISRIAALERPTESILKRAEDAYAPGKKLFSNFTPDQLAALERGRAGLGTGQKELTKAEEFFGNAGRRLIDSGYNDYTNPYLEKVLDPIKRKINEEYQKQLSNIDSMYAQNGISGSDQQILARQKAGESYQQRLGDIENQIRGEAFDRSLGYGRDDLQNFQNAGNNFLNLGNVGRQYENEDFLRQVGLGEMTRSQADLEAASEANNLGRYAGLLTQVAPNLPRTNVTGKQHSYGLSNKGHRPLQALAAVANFLNKKPVSAEEGAGAQMGGGGGSGSGGGLGSLFGGGNTQGGNQGNGFINALSQLFSRAPQTPYQTTAPSAASGPTGQSNMFRGR